MGGRIEVAGAIEGQGKTFLINHNTDNTLATLRFRLSKVPMEAAEEPFEADGLKFKAGTFVVRNADRGELEKAAREIGIKVHATDAKLSVPTHPVAAPRVAIVHNWQSTQNDGWYRIAFTLAALPLLLQAPEALLVTVVNARHAADAEQDRDGVREVPFVAEHGRQPCHVVIPDERLRALAVKELVVPPQRVVQFVEVPVVER